MKNRPLQHFLKAALTLAVSLTAPAAFAQFYNNSYLEAECPNTFTGNYGTRQTSVAGASLGGYIRSNGNTTVNTFSSSTSADTATYSFNLRSAGNYTLWFLVNTNNSASDDSWFYQINGTGGWQVMNNVPAASGWRWVQAPGQFPLSEGAKTLQIANREDGLLIDKAAIVYWSDPAPTGMGGQAYNCPVPVYFETECRKTAFGTYQLDKKTKTDASGSYIESVTDSLSSADSSTDRSTYTFESGAGSYNFYFRVNNNQNANDDSWYYRVDGGSWQTVNNTSGLGSGWRWAQGTGSVTLTRGYHTFEVRNRESGLSMDKIAFIPNGATAPSGSSQGSASVNCEPFVTMNDWIYVEQSQYYQTHKSFVTAMGHHWLEHHYDWHEVNGSGGDRGNGSGTAFLGFHRAMVNEFRKYALENGGRTWLPVAIAGDAVASVGDAYEALQGVGMLEQYYPRTNEVLMDIGMPVYLGGTSGTANWPSSVTIGSTTYTSLSQFTTLEALGQAIGTTYHGFFHIQVGGTMGDLYSPADPIFYGWHGLLDKVVDNWLATTNGKAWATANPSHPFLVQGFTSMDGWNNADWD